MRHHTAPHSRFHSGISKRFNYLKGSLSHTADRIGGKTNRILAKSLRNVKAKSKNVDKIVIKNRYQTIGAAMVAGLCIGYFLRK